MADDNLPAKFYIHPFSRFAGIHLSVQFKAKTQGGSLWKKFSEERVNRRQLTLVLSVEEVWGYHTKETRRYYLFWFEHKPRVSQTDRQTCL